MFLFCFFFFHQIFRFLFITIVDEILDIFHLDGYCHIQNARRIQRFFYSFSHLYTLIKYFLMKFKT